MTKKEELQQLILKSEYPNLSLQDAIMTDVGLPLSLKPIPQICVRCNRQSAQFVCDEVVCSLCNHHQPIKRKPLTLSRILRALEKWYWKNPMSNKPGWEWYVLRTVEDWNLDDKAKQSPETIAKLIELLK